MTSKNLNELVINQVENQDVFEYMKANGFINEDELYLVGGANESILYTAQTLTEDKKAQARENIGAASVADLNIVQTTLEDKAEKGHTHDDRYYTETEVDTKLSGKSDTGHNHNSAYDTKGAASSALSEAKAYTDSVASGKADTDHNHDSDYDAKGAANSALASAKAYADSAANTAATNVKNDLLNGAGAAYDTLKELGDLIDDNTDAIDALEAVAAGKADSDHTHSGYASSIHSHDVATTSEAGYMSATDKEKLNGLSQIEVVTWTIEDLPTSTFTIDGTSYRFVSGMTWKDWVACSYNTDGFAELTNAHGDTTVVLNGKSVQIITDPVLMNDVIDSSIVYTIANSNEPT